MEWNSAAISKAARGNHCIFKIVKRIEGSTFARVERKEFGFALIIRIPPFFTVILKGPPT